MRVVLQRVQRASVSIEGQKVGEIGQGLVVLLGIAPGDTAQIARKLADKIVTLRIFADSEGKMNLSALDIAGGVLIISQFTLYGDTRKGRRPSFLGAAQPDVAIPLYETFIEAVRAFGVPTATGRFGADMQIELVNDGPVTLILDMGNEEGE